MRSYIRAHNEELPLGLRCFRTFRATLVYGILILLITMNSYSTSKGWSYLFITSIFMTNGLINIFYKWLLSVNY